MSRRLFLFSTLALSLAGIGRAQTFYFNDGKKASLPEARIQGLNIVVPLKLSGADGGSAEISLPISTIKRMDWPAPPAIAQAEDDLKAGKPADALKKIDAILGAQEIFREIPGSWWSKGAVVKAIALARLGKDVDAGVTLELMRLTKAPADDIARGEIAIIDQLVASGKIDDAAARLAKIQSTATDDASLAAIALIKGKMLANSGHAEDALLSYLRVPVFYSTESDKMPAALLGAARAYRKLGDETRAAATITTLTTDFPDSPEAAEAKR